MVTWAFVELEEVGSTQAVARDLASTGAPEGTTVVAKSQASGAGRLGRGWASPVGGLYMSFILRPPAIPRPELATLVSAAAVVQGVRAATGLAPAIRWPNDVMVNGKKLAGVIAEAQSYRQELTLVVGVGVNCNSPVSQIGGLKGEATSIGEELGKDVAVSEVARSILGSFSALYERWCSGEDLRGAWAREVGTVGKEVSVKLKTGENAFSGVAQGLDADGNLVVSLEGGPVTIRAEDLERLRERA